MRARNLLIALVALLGGVRPAVAADCAGVFVFRPNDRLSIEEFASLAGDEHAYGPNEDTILVAHITDWEDSAARGRWDLLAVVYGGIVGAGTTSIGGTLWVPRREAFGTGGGLTFRKAKDGVVLTFKPPQDRPIKGCKAGFTFRFDSKGVLYANGARVGQSQEPK